VRHALYVLGAAAIVPTPTFAQLNASVLYTYNQGTFNSTSVFDQSGNNVNGTYSPNPPGFTASGYQGGAFTFSAPSNNFITTPFNINPSVVPQVTFGGWFKPSTASAAGGNQGLISDDNGGFKRGIDIDTRGGTGLRFSAFTGSGVLGGSPVVANTWTFVAVRYNQTTSAVKLDVDAASFTATTSLSDGLTSTTIGRNPTFDNPFDGQIDATFFFNRYLTDAEISQIRTQGEAAFVVVPEPTAIVAVTTGLVGLAGVSRRQRPRDKN
jgi:hypothetical protein